MESYCLYIHTNKTNNKKYVGITCRKPQTRWGRNGSNYKECTCFYNAIQKYGWDNFDHSVIETGLSQEEAFLKEKEYIKTLHTQDRQFGYNISDGGDTGPALFGEQNPNYHIERSEEYCKHL